jgi:hypothetical protein
MPIFRGPGGAGDATNDATVTAVQAAATSAATSATNAANSATAAANSATGAATSATNASNSATTAAGQATTAANSATNSATFATNSSLSADDAADSATEAAGYASQANDSEVAASTSASAAATSATNAAASSATATTAVNNALALYGDAAALDAAVTAAQLAETNAETAETNAETAATTATNAASTATTQATNAAASAVAADADATSASIDANEAQAAATAAQAAVSSATAIYGSIEDIQQAEANSEANRDAAAASATSASNSASTATTQAGIATTQATNAATSAAQASAVALGNEPVRHSVRPSLLLDFANTKTLDPRITFTRASTGTFYDGKTVAKAEENLVLHSEAFDNALWTKVNSTVTANSTAAPDGTTTADTFTATSGTVSPYLLQNSSLAAATRTVTASIYAKKNTHDFFQVWISNGGTESYANFNLNTGVVGSAGSGVTNHTIQNIGNGWYRCSFTFVPTTLNILTCPAIIGSATATRLQTFSAAGTESVFIWGAQFEERANLSAYTATTTQAITNYIPVLLTAAAGVARFEHNPVTGESLGLEIEEQRTNLFTYSEQFDNAAWAKSNATITANTNIAPDGTQTAELLNGTTIGNNQITQLQTKASSAITYTFSCYLKAYTSTVATLVLSDNITGEAAVQFNLSAGTAGSVSAGTWTSGSATITAVGNNWYRCTLTATSPVNTGLLPCIRLGTATSVFIWGAQLEAGAFATSYIPTVASQVTRSADSASMTGTNFSSWYRTDEGTLYAESRTISTAVSGRGIVSINDGTANNVIQTYNSTTGGVYEVVVGGTTQASATVASTNTANVSNKRSLAYKTDNSRFYTTAGSSALDTSCRVPTVTQLVFGRVNGAAAGSEFNGCISKLAYYPLRLVDAELSSLTVI